MSSKLTLQSIRINFWDNFWLILLRSDTVKYTFWNLLAFKKIHSWLGNQEQRSYKELTRPYHTSPKMSLAQTKWLLVLSPETCDEKYHRAVGTLEPLVGPFSVRLKPGFDIGNRNQGPISVSDPKLFFRKPKLFFSKQFKFLSCFLTPWGDMDFYKLENNLEILENI